MLNCWTGDGAGEAGNDGGDAHYRIERGSGFPAGRLLFLLLIVLVVVIGVAQVRENGAHTVKHGPDVTSIHKCLEDSGPAQVWQSRSWRTPGKHFLLCEDQPGQWGFMIVEKVRSGWREVSTFRVKGGSWSDTFEYLQAIARRVR